MSAHDWGEPKHRVYECRRCGMRRTKMGSWQERKWSPWRHFRAMPEECRESQEVAPPTPTE